LSLVLGPLAALAEPTTATTHVVEPGETLWQIADRLGVDPATLVTLNGLDDANLLSVGQKLSLPARASAGAGAPAAAAAPTAVAAPAAARTYAVADGDTLWDIAQQFGTTTDALVQANHLDDPDHLALGAQLAVPVANAAPPPTPASGPAPGVRASAAASPAAPRRRLLVSYTVQPGETLNQIARQFDVRADAVAQASGLDDPNRLSVGTVLKVPVPGKEHVVIAGETLRDIAMQEKVDLGSLVDFNQLDDPELIRVGQVVLVPVPASQPPAAPATATSVPAQPAPGAPTSAATPVATPAPAAPSGSSPARPPAPTPTPAPPAAAPPAPAQAAPTPAPTPSGQLAAGKVGTPLVVPPAPKGAPTEGLAGAALKLLGAPYVWGGSSPSGFDCSGFVWYVARQLGKPLSRGMLGEYNGGAHPARDELKPGDLVFFQNTYSPGLSHNGIYIGNGQFVHAADEAAGVTISSLGTPYWSSHWFGATRLP
jgi:cell wall-associated NlpC family hydrolase/nucleoid-associated protein YgaU